MAVFLRVFGIEISTPIERHHVAIFLSVFNIRNQVELFGSKIPFDHAMIPHVEQIANFFPAGISTKTQISRSAGNKLVSARLVGFIKKQKACFSANGFQVLNRCLGSNLGIARGVGLKDIIPEITERFQFWFL